MGGLLPRSPARCLDCDGASDTRVGRARTSPHRLCCRFLHGIVPIHRVLLNPSPMQRDTKQRRAIRRVFLETGRPLTPEEVVDEGQRFAATLGIATVYRNVKRLAEDGWLVAVELPGAPVRYERADRPHHHHFVCGTCEQAYDVEGCPPDIESLAPRGFQVESHEVVLYGTCAACVR